MRTATQLICSRLRIFLPLLAILLALLPSCSSGETIVSQGGGGTTASSGGGGTIQSAGGGGGETASTSSMGGAGGAGGGTGGGTGGTTVPPGPSICETVPQPVTDHPRLWITNNDLSALQAKAIDSNPLWKALLEIQNDAKYLIDAGIVPEGDLGTSGGDDQNTYYHTERVAIIFAFLHQVHPVPEERAKAGETARDLFMYVINQVDACNGATEGPFCDWRFSTRDRAHFNGYAFGLMYDWIYDILTAEERAATARVFDRWWKEIRVSNVTGNYAHPTPVGVVNDPALLHIGDINEPSIRRFALNNHFLFHGLNLVLHAEAAREDALPDYDAFNEALGAWFYMSEDAFLTQPAPGVSPEGPGYRLTSFGSVLQAQLALRTSGRNDVSLYGPQACIDTQKHPYWSQAMPAYLASLAPEATLHDGSEYLGPIYSQFEIGDSYRDVHYQDGKFLLPLAILAEQQGDTWTTNAAKWAAMRAMGAETIQAYGQRMESSLQSWSVREAILAFLAFDLDEAEPTDPRPDLPTVFFSTHPETGMTYVCSRTSWDKDATQVCFYVRYGATIDHQWANGGTFLINRKGKMLTGPRLVYGERGGCSDFQNAPTYHSSWYPATGNNHFQIQARAGSQFSYAAYGDPLLLRASANDGFVYMAVEMANLYNSDPQNAPAQDTASAVRQLFSFGDTVVVADRGETYAGLPKRWWLNGTLATFALGDQASTENGDQRLSVTSLLPSGSAFALNTDPPIVGGWNQDSNQGNLMERRVMSEAGTNEDAGSFFMVLQAADDDVTLLTPELLSVDPPGSFHVAQIGNIIVAMPADIYLPIPPTSSFTAANSTSLAYILGLEPNGMYAVDVANDDGIEVTLKPGGNLQADEGGVLVVNF